MGPKRASFVGSGRRCRIWALALTFVALILFNIGRTVTPPLREFSSVARRDEATIISAESSVASILAVVVPRDSNGGDEALTKKLERARAILRTWGAPGGAVDVRILEDEEETLPRGARYAASSSFPASIVHDALADGIRGAWTHFLIVDDTTFVVTRNLLKLISAQPSSSLSPEPPRMMGSRVAGWPASSHPSSSGHISSADILAGAAGILLNRAAAELIAGRCNVEDVGPWDAWLMACWQGRALEDTRERGNSKGAAPVDVFNAFGPVVTARAELDEKFMEAKLAAVGGQEALFSGQHRWCCASRPVTFGGVGAQEADALHEVLGLGGQGRGAWLKLTDAERLARWPPPEEGRGMDRRPDYADPVWDFLLVTAAGQEAEAESCLAGFEPESTQPLPYTKGEVK